MGEYVKNGVCPLAPLQRGVLGNVNLAYKPSLGI